MITNYTGAGGSRVAYLAAAELNEHNKALIAVSTGSVAALLADDLAFCAPDTEIIVLPEEEDLRILYEARNRENQVLRLGGLSALADDADRKVAVIAPASALLRRTPEPERFIESVRTIRTGDIIEPSDLRLDLVRAGYSAATVTESPGEFTARGGILDIFSPALSNPVRIEFFDDEIDSIRSYDPATQRSVENLTSVTIGPAAEFIPSDDEKAAALKKIKKEYADAPEDFARIRESFEHGGNVQIFSDFLEYFDVEESFIWDYLNGGTAIIVDPGRIEEAAAENINIDKLHNMYMLPEISIFTPFPERINGLEAARGGYIDKIVNVRSRQVAPFNGKIDLFARELENLVRGGYSIRIISSSDERNERIREYVEIADIHGNITYETGALSAGFIFDDEKVCWITEGDIFPQARKRRTAKHRRKSNGSISFSDLSKGDYVVHEQHGIGRFEGIHPLTADGVTSDYLVIRYAGSDVLYIPTDQLDVIQKYIGSGGDAPMLSRLSGGSWKRTRERARKAIEVIAEDLVKLYAEREAAGGYAFPADTVWQQEFEEDFPYTETDDQLKAAEDIKEDMEKPVPMDRLLCGDVGYGKTEVAARAIFKCISNGKQAALLAPTTLLVNQHYHNLKERFQNFPFEIEELSRFRTGAEQKKITEKIASGDIDLVIGTHRLLSDDVRFKDLGLLVIDEEQRFGVQHKEKIKKLKKNVDVLTLSATPIPRTLNMSLTGIKDISMIDEPPGNRYPVQTYVSPYDEEMMRSAIERELARGGQVFVVNNRITGIKQIAEKIEELVPDAIVATGHGRMSEDVLEKTILDFIEGRTNVLVATTIIENGIDIPNANTMIVLNADRLGLAQLYQLRGRVGRSDRIAYAYLTYQPQKVLTQIARKRLAAIRDFTEFGAGFRIAMRDLELRGAGNILGEAQSGHIEGIGYELYCKEIDRAVRRLKGEAVPEERSDIMVDLQVNAQIPESYINDEALRLEAYKKIAEITCRADSEDVTDELLDRYGDPPAETVALIRISEIRAHAAMLGAKLISHRGNDEVIKFAEKNNINAYALVIAREQFGDKLTMRLGKMPELTLRTGRKPDPAALLELMRTLEEETKNAVQQNRIS